MRRTYLKVTYRKGRAFAAYYYLPRRDGDTCARTERFEGGLLVDYSPDGRPIGIEITSPSRLNLSEMNSVLSCLGQEVVRSEDLAPIAAA